MFEKLHNKGTCLLYRSQMIQQCLSTVSDDDDRAEPRVLERCFKTCERQEQQTPLNVLDRSSLFSSLLSIYTLYLILQAPKPGDQILTLCTALKSKYWHTGRLPRGSLHSMVLSRVCHSRDLAHTAGALAGFFFLLPSRQWNGMVSTVFWPNTP